MKTKTTIATTVIAATLALGVGCSHKPKEASTEDLVKTSQATAAVGGGEYIVVNFNKGTRQLSEADKTKLRTLAAEAPHRGKIAKYEVLAWADREYPTEGQKATTKESRLAEERADTIANYLKKELNTTESVSAHNMAKRPGVFAEVFRSNDYKLKNTFEATGAAPGDHANAIEKMESKASKAVVLVKYE